MIRIALDAMGGDRAPRMIVEGAARASLELDCHIFLVGKERNIKIFLAKTVYSKDKITRYWEFLSKGIGLLMLLQLLPTAV